jgi:Tfp pilus assembly protein PilN
MSRVNINLLPPEIVRRRQARRQAALLAAGVAALALVMLLVYVVQAGRLSTSNSKLAEQERTNAGIQAEINRLQQFAQQQQDLSNKRQLLVALTANEVRWSGVLRDIATFIPSDVWLTQFNGSVQVQAPGTRTTGSAGQSVTTTYGQVQFGGCTLIRDEGTHVAVAAWLTRLGAPRQFVNAYLTLSAKGSLTCPATYNMSVQLTDQALRRNQRGGARTP